MFFKKKSQNENLEKLILKEFSKFKHYTLKKNLVTLNVLKSIAIKNNILNIELIMPFPWNSGFHDLKKYMHEKLLKCLKVDKITWFLFNKIIKIRTKEKNSNMHKIKNIIAVSSSKGGVGKSSTAVNLALALIAEGAKVGILDADIYGPSIPNMLGAKNSQIISPDGVYMQPTMSYGLATNSIGYFFNNDDKNTAIVWRGLMASKALIQLFNETLWPELDYLVIDMPPGTGDIQLTLAKDIPVTGAIIVTTPQNIAIIDAQKGMAMFNKVNIPVIGIVENMSTYICHSCGNQESIFGTDGVEKLVKNFNTFLLKKLPLHIFIRQDLDLGKPTVINRPDSFLTTLYRELAASIASELYWQNESN